MRLSPRSLLLTLSMVALALIGTFAVTSAASARSLSIPTGGAVYTETNAASGNAVVAFSRSSSGALAPLGTYATGGAGVGGTVDPLQSQYAVILSQDGRWLFAVNAGSNSVTAFAVHHDGTLTQTDTVASGGLRPVSLATHDDLLYVLNNGGTVDNTHGTGNITGFRLDDGRLNSLSHSTRLLSGSNVGASTIAFSRDGRFLLVTERASNTLDRYVVDEHGDASDPSVTTAAANSPFGFSFGLHDVAVIS
ncbi:MAG TPA: beta-propeller fold lactonase family protein, partial [Ktedonobacterales bacterium]|nr:beta-propeller fold lactonase family protein [Ktedonobacterales bacterium]